MNKNLYEVSIVPKLDKNNNPLVDSVWYVPAYTEQQALEEMQSTKNVEQVVSIEFVKSLSKYW